MTDRDILSSACALHGSRGIAHDRPWQASEGGAGPECEGGVPGTVYCRKKESRDPRHDTYIDAVLNFNDINKWLEEEDIVIEDCEDQPFTAFDPRVNRLYPVTNGVVNSVLATEEESDGYRKFYVHGVANCIDLCKSMSRGEIKGCFIEMNACHGGCINGPATAATVSSFKVKLDLEATLPREPAELSALSEKARAVSIGRTFKTVPERDYAYGGRDP